MAKKYEQVWDDEPFLTEVGEDLDLSCCDCGLVHTFAILPKQRNKKKVLEWTVTRNNRATASLRRTKQGALQKLEDGKRGWILVRF